MLAQAIGYSSEEEVIQNLKDAGCSQEIIVRFMKYMSQDNVNGQLQLMDEHRKYLLDRVHEEEKQIGCLDYLVYQINRSRRNSE